MKQTDTEIVFEALQDLLNSKKENYHRSIEDNVKFDELKNLRTEIARLEKELQSFSGPPDDWKK